MYISSIYDQSVVSPPLVIHFNVDKNLERISAEIVNLETRRVEKKYLSIGSYDMNGRLYIPPGILMDMLV